MQIKINIKPVRVTGPNKAMVMTRINTHHCWSVGSYHNGCLVSFGRFSHTSDEVVRVYNLEKRNKKVSRKRTAGKVVNGQQLTGKTISKVVSPAHWVGHYYDIPISLLRTAKLKVIQHNRHFELTSI